MENKVKKVVLTGGGTAGSVSPLLAIADDLKKSGDFSFLFLGTKDGIEKEMVAGDGLQYKAILAGKMRRYFDWRNFLDIFKIGLAFWQAFFVLLKEKPDAVLSAGSFVAVPVVWAAWVLRIPAIVHQMDVRPGLANKVMASFAKVITVTFEKSLKDYGAKAVWTGNPVRQSVIGGQQALSKERFDLKNDLPVIFIFGGGTGAEAINNLVEEKIDELCSFCQVIHSTGKGKMTAVKNENYHPFEFLNVEEMAAALGVADIVVSRAGLGAFTDLAKAGKASIIIPMPNSHQEDNAKLLAEKEAALVLNQKTLTADSFLAEIKELLFDEIKKEKFRKNIKTIFKDGANEAVIEIFKSLI
jgi:UDP-N-acetylglucosamine--N-acetylmuramyl-(pentapeptide) pyrophosphoryl-undecaprenol N-acetylglucosamine transferase